MEIAYRTIGRIRSPFSSPEGTPIQPAAARGVRGSIEIEPAYAAGLQDLEGFSHVIVLWHMHLVNGWALTVVPFLDDRERGIFATRSPKRPNPIGLSVARARCQVVSAFGQGGMPPEHQDIQMDTSPRISKAAGLAVLLALLATAPAGAQMAMPQAPRAPIAPIRIQLSANTFAGLPRVTMTVKEENGSNATYSGVNLDAVLTAAGAPKGTGISGMALATYVLVRATDGYRAVFALPELDAAFTDRVTLLADQRNGGPLPADIGPYRIVVPGEGRRARWIHGVVEVDVLPIP